MKERVKPANRKNKDKSPEKLGKETTECYESTLVNN
jgi:hypothetical protein